MEEKLMFGLVWAGLGRFGPGLASLDRFGTLKFMNILYFLT